MKKTSLVLLLVVALGACVLAGEQEPFAVTTRLSATEVPAGGEFELVVRFELAKGVHLYKDRIEFTWDEVVGAERVAIEKPPGRLVPDLASLEPGAKLEAYEGSAEVRVCFRVTGQPGGKVVVKGKVGYQGCTDTMCYRPMETAFAHEAAISGAAPTAGRTAGATAEAARPEGGKVALGLGVILADLLKAFLWGLAISLTPCVYPMIPITVAIVGGQQRTRLQALSRTALYVLGIALTYSLLGYLVATLGASVRNAFRSPWLLVPVGGIFVVLALGMFDVINIQAPQALGRLSGRLSGRGGLVGILLLGVVSGVAAGPCVAAPLVALLVEIARIGSPAMGAAMMFSMAWGMSLLLLVAGLSTGLLPKAGAWTVGVKKLFGFVLLWAALYFVRPVVGEAAYWLGSAAVVLAGAVFLGLTDAIGPDAGFKERLKRFAGLVAVFAAAGLALHGFGGGGAGLGSPALAPQAASLFAEGDTEAVDAALGAGKPVLLDFTGEWCGYCKVLDRTTFSHPAVVEELRRFRAFKVDVSARGAAGLVRRYDIPGPPLVLVFDSAGKQVARLTYEDAKKPEAVAELLRKVK